LSKEIFDTVLQVEAQSNEIHNQIGQLKYLIAKLLEENNKLKIENDNLRKHFDKNLMEIDRQTDKSDQKAEVEKPNFAYNNLTNLYNEGFHICNDQFGRPRSDECLFCTPFLNKFTKSS
ncbi:MAG: replication initiation control protein YabA, partial [Bacillales bacterium]|jgi:regulator of replication initiation timing|nr:replication initiation control protein YabA [Bacillales bacterium]